MSKEDFPAGMAAARVRNLGSPTPSEPNMRPVNVWAHPPFLIIEAKLEEQALWEVIPVGKITLLNPRRAPKPTDNKGVAAWVQSMFAHHVKAMDEQHDKQYPVGSAYPFVVSGSGPLRAIMQCHYLPYVLEDHANSIAGLRAIYHEALSQVTSYAVLTPVFGAGVFKYPIREAVRVCLQETEAWVNRAKGIKRVVYIMSPDRNLAKIINDELNAIHGTNPTLLTEQALLNNDVVKPADVASALGLVSPYQTRLEASHDVAQNYKSKGPKSPRHHQYYDFTGDAIDFSKGVDPTKYFKSVLSAPSSDPPPYNPLQPVFRGSGTLSIPSSSGSAFAPPVKPSAPPSAAAQSEKYLRDLGIVHQTEEYVIPPPNNLMTTAKFAPLLTPEQTTPGVIKGPGYPTREINAVRERLDEMVLDLDEMKNDQSQRPLPRLRRDSLEERGQEDNEDQEEGSERGSNRSFRSTSPNLVVGRNEEVRTTGEDEEEIVDLLGDDPPPAQNRQPVMSPERVQALINQARVQEPPPPPVFGAPQMHSNRASPATQAPQSLEPPEGASDTAKAVALMAQLVVKTNQELKNIAVESEKKNLALAKELMEERRSSQKQQTELMAQVLKAQTGTLELIKTVTTPPRRRLGGGAQSQEEDGEQDLINLDDEESWDDVNPEEPVMENDRYIIELPGDKRFIIHMISTAKYEPIKDLVVLPIGSWNGEGDPKAFRPWRQKIGRRTWEVEERALIRHLRDPQTRQLSFRHRMIFEANDRNNPVDNVYVVMITANPDSAKQVHQHLADVILHESYEITMDLNFPEGIYGHTKSVLTRQFCTAAATLLYAGPWEEVRALISDQALAKECYTMVRVLAQNDFRVFLEHSPALQLGAYRANSREASANSTPPRDESPRVMPSPISTSSPWGRSGQNGDEGSPVERRRTRSPHHSLERGEGGSRDPSPDRRTVGHRLYHTAGRMARARDQRAVGKEWPSYDATKWPARPAETDPPNEKYAHDFNPLCHEEPLEPRWNTNRDPPEWFPHGRAHRRKILASPTSSQIGGWKGVSNTFKQGYMARAHDAFRDNLSDIYEALPEERQGRAGRPRTVSPARSVTFADEQEEDWDSEEEQLGPLPDPPPVNTPQPQAQPLHKIHEQMASSFLSRSDTSQRVQTPGIQVSMKMSLSDVCQAIPKRKPNEGNVQFAKRILKAVPANMHNDEHLSLMVSNHCNLGLVRGQTLEDLATSESTVFASSEVEEMITDVVPQVNSGVMPLVQGYSSVLSKGPDDNQIKKFLSAINHPQLSNLLVDYNHAVGMEGKHAVIRKYSELMSTVKEIRKLRERTKNPEPQQKQSKNEVRGERAPGSKPAPKAQSSRDGTPPRRPVTRSSFRGQSTPGRGGNNGRGRGPPPRQPSPRLSRQAPQNQQNRGRGRGNPNIQNQTQQTSRISDDAWAKMTAEEKKAHVLKMAKRCRKGTLGPIRVMAEREKRQDEYRRRSRSDRAEASTSTRDRRGSRDRRGEITLTNETGSITATVVPAARDLEPGLMDWLNIIAHHINNNEGRMVIQEMIARTLERQDRSQQSLGRLQAAVQSSERDCKGLREELRKRRAERTGTPGETRTRVRTPSGGESSAGGRAEKSCTQRGPLSPYSPQSPPPERAPAPVPVKEEEEEVGFTYPTPAQMTVYGIVTEPIVDPSWTLLTTLKLGKNSPWLTHQDLPRSMFQLVLLLQALAPYPKLLPCGSSTSPSSKKNQRGTPPMKRGNRLATAKNQIGRGPSPKTAPMTSTTEPNRCQTL